MRKYGGVKNRKIEHFMCGSPDEKLKALISKRGRSENDFENKERRPAKRWRRPKGLFEFRRR